MARKGQHKLAGDRQTRAQPATIKKQVEALGVNPTELLKERQ